MDSATTVLAQYVEMGRPENVVLCCPHAQLPRTCRDQVFVFDRCWPQLDPALPTWLGALGLASCQVWADSCRPLAAAWVERANHLVELTALITQLPAATLTRRKRVFQLGSYLARRSLLGLPYQELPEPFSDCTDSRSLTLTALKQLGISSSATTRAYQLAVDSGCSGCETCLRACPSRALGSEFAEGHWVLRQDPRLCSGCDICIRLCPETAISVAAALTWSELQDCEELTLVRRQASRCQRCRSYVLADETTPAGSLCDTCANADPFTVRLPPGLDSLDGLRSKSKPERIGGVA